MSDIKTLVRNRPNLATALGWIALLSPLTTALANTFQQQLDLASSSFSQGNWSASYWHFERLELDYGQQPEFLSRNFQQTILPVRGYAALMADRPTDALIHFGELLSQYPPKPRLRAFALYNAAIAQSQTHARAIAAQTFRNFQLTFPECREAALAQLQEAELLLESGDKAQAMSLLDALYASDAPKSLRMQARLRALQIAIDAPDSIERSCAILFNTVWDINAMPDIAILSFAALDAGDNLLEQGLYSQALRAYRLVLPHALLLDKQRRRLEELKQSVAQQSSFASNIWKSHSQQQLTRLARQLEQLEHMADYTPSLYLRAGQAYLLEQRYREATILFAKVARMPEYTASIRGEAYYRWIVARCEAEDWAGAREIAQAFRSEQPSHPLASDALFLVAHAYQGEGRLSEAIQVLHELIALVPDAPQAPRWYFTLGYNYCVLEQQAKARDTFTTALQRFPSSNLAAQIELWYGLTYFFERSYAESLRALKALEQKTATHPLHAEIQFRIANIYYAQRDYHAALHSAETLIEQFPEHQRIPAAQALRGDIFMGQGELSRAAHAFKQVPGDATRLFDYATFQACKIYKALQRYDLLRQHLHNYVERDDAYLRPRLSEALYWIGWSLQQEGRSAESFALFEQALQRFGNDPAAASIDTMLSAYAKLYQSARQKDATSELDFDQWLQNASQQSLADAKLTWFARVNRCRAQRQRRAHGDATADGTLLAIHRFVPIEKQDPATLARVGQVLAQRGYKSADAYFEQILSEYPKHAERASAYYGKAQLAAAQQALESAHRWLLRFQLETPTHPLAADVRLLSATILRRQGLYSRARAVLNEMLQIKQMRGRGHARALAGLARIETELDHPKRAIPYWQRIYTLYRAYPEIIIDAYWESAQLFEAIGDWIAARNTLQELLSDQRLQAFAAYQLAQTRLPEVEALIANSNALASRPTGKSKEPQ
jgi:TolA-binding protein